MIPPFWTCYEGSTRLVGAQQMKHRSALIAAAAISLACASGPSVARSSHDDPQPTHGHDEDRGLGHSRGAPAPVIGLGLPFLMGASGIAAYRRLRRKH